MPATTVRSLSTIGNATSELSKALVRRADASVAKRPSAELVKRPSAEITTRTSGEIAKRPSGEISNRSSGEIVRRASGEIANRSSGEIARRSSGELVKRSAGEIAKSTVPEPSKSSVSQGSESSIKRTAGNAARVAGTGLAMNAAKAILPIAVVAAAQKGAGEFPELEKLRREESENRRVKMQRGMKTGMGNTSPGAYIRHETHMTGLKGEYKPIEDLTGYAVSLIQKGKSFDEAKKLMQGTEKFRGMSDDMKKMTLNYYDTWQKNQLSPSRREKLDRYLASEKD